MKTRRRIGLNISFTLEALLSDTGLSENKTVPTKQWFLQTFSQITLPLKTSCLQPKKRLGTPLSPLFPPLPGFVVFIGRCDEIMVIVMHGRKMIKFEENYEFWEELLFQVLMLFGIEQQLPLTAAQAATSDLK